MNIITYLKPNVLMKNVFGYVLFLLGLFIAVTTNILFGLIFIAIGINMVSTEGSEINLSTRTYRKVKSVFGINIGKWKAFPDFEYVSVFKTKENQTVNVVSATTTFTNDIIMLNLFYDRNKHITVYKTDDRANAFKVANHLKLALNIDVLDATGSEKVWL